MYIHSIFQQEVRMNIVQTIEKWGDTHHSRFLDIIRIILGLLLFAKGISFISDNEEVQRLMRQTTFNQYGLLSLVIVHYVAFAHLMGGALIALGLLTRIACAFQIPVLIGAVFFVNLTGGFSALNSELWLSVITLILLLFFFVSGSGKFSVDEVMKNHRDK